MCNTAIGDGIYEYFHFDTADMDVILRSKCNKSLLFSGNTVSDRTLE